MKQVSVHLSEQQAEELLEQLPPSQKLQLVRRWAHQTWPTRFRQLLAQIDRRARRQPRLMREALKAVDPARRAFHARRPRH